MGVINLLFTHSKSKKKQKSLGKSVMNVIGVKIVVQEYVRPVYLKVVKIVY